MSAPVDLSALKARIAAATAGPWYSRRNQQKPYKHVQFSQRGMYDTSPLEASDANFIAHARTDLPQCVKVIEALCAALAQADDVLVAGRDWPNVQRAKEAIRDALARVTR